MNQPYATTVGGSGGITPYSWSVTPALPANLTFDTATGAITGTPAAQGTSSHTFTLQDSSSPVQTVQKTLSLTINTCPIRLVDHHHIAPERGGRPGLQSNRASHWRDRSR